jgi:hypothetical protein
MLAYSAKVVSVVLRQFVNFAAMLWWEQVKFRWDDGEVRFVIDQYTYLNFDSASSLIDMSPHSDTLSLFQSNQSLLFLDNAVYLAENQQILIL